LGKKAGSGVLPGSTGRSVKVGLFSGAGRLMSPDTGADERTRPEPWTGTRPGRWILQCPYRQAAGAVVGVDRMRARTIAINLIAASMSYNSRRRRCVPLVVGGARR
jgi:hypothetical protein